MSIYPESQLGIWLNTPIKFLETTAERNLRGAQNDARWSNDAVVGTIEPTRLKELDEPGINEQISKTAALSNTLLRMTRDSCEFGLYRRESCCCPVHRSARWRLLRAVDQWLGKTTG